MCAACCDEVDSKLKATACENCGHRRKAVIPLSSEESRVHPVKARRLRNFWLRRVKHCADEDVMRSAVEAVEAKDATNKELSYTARLRYGGGSHALGYLHDHLGYLVYSSYCWWTWWIASFYPGVAQRVGD